MIHTSHIPPIVVSPVGEELLACTGEIYGEDDVLVGRPSCIVHNHCGGVVIARDVSSSHRALTCDVCMLRLVVPKGVKTFGDLRYFFSGDFYSFSKTTGEFRRHPRVGRPAHVAAENCLFCEERGGCSEWFERGRHCLCPCVKVLRGV